MNNKILAPLVLTFSLSLLASCGGKDKSSSKKPSNAGAAIQEQQAEGSYRAILRPFNISLSGFIPTGAAEIKIAGDSVQVKTLLDDDARVSHMQSVHVGTRCPSLSDDKNGDGLVDIKEAMAVTGDVLIPLDSDINSAEEGVNIYPLGGGFTYVETASLSKLESDVKARTGQSLNLGGRVVMIHGVAANATLPTTGVALEGMTPQASAPIGCGILKRLD